MSKRSEHLFQFEAVKIGEAAGREAEYHEQRLAYWQAEYDEAVLRVEATIGAKIERQAVTQGEQVKVVVDYGDPVAYRRMTQAWAKIATHREAAERLRTDEKVYTTQARRLYELDTADVHYYRLGGGPREE